MKKAIMTAALLIITASLCAAADNMIKSMLGVPFGEICVIKAEFIDKGDDYYSKNVSKAEYYLKIYEINGKEASKPFVAEPIIYDKMMPEKGKMYILKAFEMIRSEGNPRGWTEETGQFNYGINHYIVIKSP